MILMVTRVMRVASLPISPSLPFSLLFSIAPPSIPPFYLHSSHLSSLAIAGNNAQKQRQASTVCICLPLFMVFPYSPPFLPFLTLPSFLPLWQFRSRA